MIRPVTNESHVLSSLRQWGGGGGGAVGGGGEKCLSVRTINYIYMQFARSCE